MNVKILCLLFSISTLGCQTNQKPIEAANNKIKNLTLELLQGEWESSSATANKKDDISLELSLQEGVSNQFAEQGDFSLLMGTDFWVAGKTQLSPNADTLFLFRDNYVDVTADDHTSSLRNIGDTSYLIITDIGKDRLSGIFKYAENGMPMSQELALR